MIYMILNIRKLRRLRIQPRYGKIPFVLWSAGVAIVIGTVIIGKKGKMMRCPNNLELQSFFDGELSLKRADQIEKHTRECLTCQQTVTEFTEVVSLFKKGLPNVSVPRLSSCRRVVAFQIKWALTAAAIIIIGHAGSLIYHTQQQAKWSPETEIMEQYVILHNEASSVIPE